ncbi:MAG TPA: Crp/Fnr family transcriptional regulator [Acetobacteraceae bacterium]|nr:Crp/Fnr family transcriptional regulator [Acetobacteraceae bacterium]
MYFVDRGLISLVKTMEDGRSIEIGAIGIEGLTDPIALFGVDRVLLESVVQVPGTAFRASVEDISDAMRQDGAMADLMRRYLRFSFHQLAQTAACNRLHSLDERCCRWLLIAHDSARTDTFPLTHEFLAMMLGAQRAGVTIAANSLRRAGLIQYRHGLITITSRTGLEAVACECYRAIEHELKTVFRTALPGEGSPGCRIAIGG